MTTVGVKTLNAQLEVVGLRNKHLRYWDGVAPAKFITNWSKPTHFCLSNAIHCMG